MTTQDEVNRLHFLHPEGNGVRILALGEQIRLTVSIIYSKPVALCFSQLLMLQELMRRLEYDHGRPVRPCEFFHSITGVGASG
jgi:hypothetical protein